MLNLKRAPFYFLPVMILVSCHNGNKHDDKSTVTADSSFNNQVPQVTMAKTDSIKKNDYSLINDIWIYDYDRDMPVKNKEVNADTLSPIKLVNFINAIEGHDKIHLEFIKTHLDTIFVKIKESTYLTQRMGSSGAKDYMSTTTFTLTELKGIKKVNFNFEEGDHATPGTYSREYYINKNKQNYQ